MAIIEGTIDIKEEKRGDVVILRLKGRLDAISSPCTEKKVFDCINSGKNKLLLDFEGVEYLSSAGVRMLLSTTKKLKTTSGKLVVCCVATNVLDLLKMSGFDHVLELSKNQEEGLRKF